MDRISFINLLDNSIKLKCNNDNNNIYYYYDKNIERSLKLRSILKKKQNITLDLNNINRNNIVIEIYSDKEKVWVDSSLYWGVEDGYNIIKKWINSIEEWKKYLVVVIRHVPPGDKFDNTTNELINLNNFYKNWQIIK